MIFPLSLLSFFSHSCLIIFIVYRADKHNVKRWMNKLLASNKTTAEMKLRNDFMYHLVMAVQESTELNPPFNQFPPSGPLKGLTYMLTGGAAGKKDAGGATVECEAPPGDDVDKPMVYRLSPDGGAFLTAQPVPRCGAFCYLAVVNKPPAKDDKPQL